MRFMRNTLVTSFMRMQPPTRGHDRIVRFVHYWHTLRGDKRIFLSHSQNTLNNPLPYGYKLDLARKLYGDIINDGISPYIRTPIDIFTECNDFYTDIVFVCGQDRVSEFRALFNKYNGKEYDYESITVVSAGNRDPLGYGVDMISGSRVREAALNGDRATFDAQISDYFVDHPPRLADQLWEHLVESTRRLHGWSSDTPTTSHTSDSNAQTSSEAETGQATS